MSTKQWYPCRCETFIVSLVNKLAVQEWIFVTHFQWRVVQRKSFWILIELILSLSTASHLRTVRLDTIMRVRNIHFRRRKWWRVCFSVAYQITNPNLYKKPKEKKKKKKMVINVIKTFIDWLNSTASRLYSNWLWPEINSHSHHSRLNKYKYYIHINCKTLITHVQLLNWRHTPPPLLYFRVIELIICW